MGSVPPSLAPKNVSTTLMLWPGKVLFGVTLSFSKIVPASEATGSAAMVVVPNTAPVIFERLPMTPPVEGDTRSSFPDNLAQDVRHSAVVRRLDTLQGEDSVPSPEL